MIPIIMYEEEILNISNEEDFEEIKDRIKTNINKNKEFKFSRGARKGLKKEIGDSLENAWELLKDKYPEYFL